MKQLLVLVVIILMSIPEVYAEDSWYNIDGIKYRYGYSIREQSLSIKDQQISSTSSQLDPNQYGAMCGRQLLPIIITFPETLMNSWSFRQAYFDISLNEKYDDVILNWIRCKISFLCIRACTLCMRGTRILKKDDYIPSDFSLDINNASL